MSDWRNYMMAILGGVVCAQLYTALKNTFSFNFQIAEVCPEACPETCCDPVVIHVGEGSYPTVSYSPFASKLLLYCRMAGIPHTNISADINKNPKKQLPFIFHGGKLIADTQLIIRYLENTFDVSTMAAKSSTHFKSKMAFVPFESLSNTQKGLCDMIRMACEGTPYWSIVSNRWLGTTGISETESNWHITAKTYFSGIPFPLFAPITAMIRAKVGRSSYGQGLSRHSPRDQLYLAQRGLKSLSLLLADKPFFVGDFPCECDCAAFGIIENVLAQDWPSALGDFVRAECPNLPRYAQRVREAFFPDFLSGMTHPPPLLEWPATRRKLLASP